MAYFKKLHDGAERNFQPKIIENALMFQKRVSETLNAACWRFLELRFRAAGDLRVPFIPSAAFLVG